MRQDRRPQVLVVDDDADVCALIAEILRHDGYEVVLSSCGEDALRRMECISGPVVLITNVMLETGMDGLELAYTMRKQWPSTAILMIGGDWPPLPLPLGQDFLGKPFSAAQLLERVAELGAGIRVSKPVLH